MNTIPPPPRSRGQRPRRGAQLPTHDGVELFYRHWPAADGPARGAIVLFHRGHEHSGRMAHLVDELGLPDFDFFAWDARGHGRSPGRARLQRRASTPRCATCRRFVDHIAADARASPIERHGGRRAERGRGAGRRRGCTTTRRASAAWCSPRRRSRSSSTCRSRGPGLALMHKLRGNFFVQSYVKAKFLTHDPARIASYDARSADHAADLGQHAARPVRRRRAHRRRRAGDHGAHAAARLGRRLGRASRPAARVLRPARRDGQGAPRAARLLSRHARASGTARAAVAQGARVPPGALRRGAGAAGSARCRPRRLHARGIRRAGGAAAAAVAARAVLGAPRARGCGSADCCRTACASARRRASIPAARSTTSTATSRRASTPLGRLIDRNYLDSIGWRGIRQRKLHLEELLRERDRAPARGAAGPCASSTSPPATAATCSRRWRQGPSLPDSILLRDYSELNVEEGAALIAREGPRRHRAFERATRSTARASRRSAAADDRHRLRALRALPRQRAGARVARRASPTPSTPDGC